jgi:MFS family permease
MSDAAAPRDRRDLHLFLLARLLSTMAMQVQSVAIGWQVYDITNDPLSLGYVGLAIFLPMVVLTLPAGDVADRVDRRRILLGSFLVHGLSAAMLLALTLAGNRAELPIYAVLALFGAARAFAWPASASYLPLLVPRARLAEAVALSSSVMKVATIVGPAVGGLLYLLRPEAAYLGCLALMLAVAAALFAIRTPGRSLPAATGAGAFARLVAGIAYVRATPIVLGAISLDLFAVLLGGAVALLPVYARDILHVGPDGLGALRTAPAIGGAVAAFALARWPLERATGPWMFASVAIFGVATIVFGLSENFLVSLAALAIVGASDMVSVYVRSTAIQLATPDSMRGRVSAVNVLFIGASNELGDFRAGVHAAWQGAVAAVVLGGVGTLAVVALWAKLFPELRRLDRLADLQPREVRA